MVIDLSGSWRLNISIFPFNPMKYLIGITYTLLLIVMALATLAERNHGTDYAHGHIYGSWWFVLLWGILAVAAVAWMVHRHVRNVGVWLLHGSLLVILLGALLTHITGRTGVVHLREGITVNYYLTDEGPRGIIPRQLPFALRLDSFVIDRHHASMDPRNFRSHIRLYADREGRGEAEPVVISMNHICSRGGYRLCQGNFDADLRGSVLSLNRDKVGLPVTYVGYAMLWVSLLWMLIAPKGSYRRLLTAASSHADAASQPSSWRSLSVQHGMLWPALLLLLAVALLAILIVRYVEGGRLPMATGYETLLFVAWMVSVLGLILGRRYPIVRVLALLMAFFFLLVSQIGQKNSSTDHISPILDSPLLGFHVSFIMLSYALLSIAFVCSVVSLIRRQTDLRQLSLLMLYPGVATLAMGIFIGAVWANISWGAYWSWDPKEVWALITLMVYAVPLHRGSITAMQRPQVYHRYMVAAFVVLLMTYFGVNYLLGGMHSYA